MVQRRPFSGGERRRTVDGKRQGQSFVRLLVPTSDEGMDETVIAALIDTLSGNDPMPEDEAEASWGKAFASLSARRRRVEV